MFSLYINEPMVHERIRVSGEFWGHTVLLVASDSAKDPRKAACPLEVPPYISSR